MNHVLIMYIVSSVISVVVISMAWLFFPEYIQKDHKMGFVFFILMGIFIPVLGVFSVFVYLVLLKKYKKRPIGKRVYQARYPVYTREWSVLPLPYEEGEAYKIVFDEKAETEARAKALSTLNSEYSPVANLINQQLLNDSDHEMRLHCFGLLNEQEKVVSEAIGKALNYLSETEDERLKGIVHKQVAFLYWELIYKKLVTQEMFKDVSEKLIFNAEKALALLKEDAGVLIMLGRYYLLIRDFDSALKWLHQALKSHGPCSQIYAYLAELHYEKQNFKWVKKYMNNCYSMPDVPKLYKAAEFWGSEDR